MRTARSLSASHSIRQGGMCVHGVCMPGGGGMHAWGDMYAWGHVCTGGMHSQGIWGHVWHACPPRGQTDTYENITFANFVCGR